MSKRIKQATAAAVSASVFDEIVAEVGAGDPPEKCKHGKYLACEECSAESWVIARRSGYDDGIRSAAKFMRDMSGEAFADGRDDEARLIRRIMLGFQARSES